VRPGIVPFDATAWLRLSCRVFGTRSPQNSGWLVPVDAPASIPETVTSCRRFAAGGRGYLRREPPGLGPGEGFLVAATPTTREEPQMAGDRQDDLINVITTDHREVEEAFGELERRTGTAEHRRQLVDHVITELVRHSVAEEQFMYPQARKALPDGDQIADHEIEEHAEAEQVMKDLEGVEATDPRFDDLVGKLISEVRNHIQEEESELLPRLAKACSPERLDELGRQVTAAKRVAPTRPHPGAPDRPPANLVLDPGAGLIDRMRDALTGRGR
jgi:hemerythrin-like domain-containing protein